MVKRAATRSRRAERRLTRARILERALGLLASRGVAGLSMRALADALGTAPMSLYRHVRGKDELCAAMVALVLERLDLDVPEGGPWTARVAAWMHSLRAQLLRFPAVVSILMPHGHYAPALLRATNRLLAILRDAGFDAAGAVRASREIMWSTLGFVSAEIRGPAFTPTFYVQALDHGAALGPEDVGEIAAHMPQMLTRDLDDVFDAIVRHLLAGMEAERAGASAPRAARAR